MSRQSVVQSSVSTAVPRLNFDKDLLRGHSDTDLSAEESNSPPPWGEQSKL